MPISKSQRFEILSRDNFTCQYCGEMAPNVILEVDHILPRAVEGGDESWNLTTACFDCNRGKQAKILKRRPGPIHIHHNLAEEQRMLFEVQMAEADAFKRYLLNRDSDSKLETLEENFSVEDEFSEWIREAHA